MSSKDPHPSVRRRRLGAELRALREDVGLTCEQVGEALDCHHSKVSRIELGHSGVRRVDLRIMLDLYNVQDQERRSALERLAGESRKRGWWQTYGDHLPPAYADFISLEQHARRIRCYPGMAIPGLLQTEDYARDVIRASLRTDSPEEIALLAEVRMTRQKRLTDPEPVHLQAIIPEAALRQRIGGHAVMREQLAYLIEAAKLPNVTLSILPDNAGAHPGLQGAFVVLGFAGAGEPDVVLVEHLRSSLYFEDAEETARYNWAFDALLAAADSPDRSIRMIEQAIRTLDHDK